MGGTEGLVQDGNLGTTNQKHTATLKCPADVTDTYLSFVPSEDFDGSITSVRLAPSCLFSACSTE
jgi:hypothetical protein